jgi:hypothetical protein
VSFEFENVENCATKKKKNQFFWKAQELKIINKIKESHDENMIKYTFHDPCQEKCKVAINQTLMY